MKKAETEWYSYPKRRPKEDDDYLVVVHTGESSYVCAGNWSSHDEKFKDPILEAVYTSEHALMKDAPWDKWYNCSLDTFNKRIIAWAHIPKSHGGKIYLKRAEGGKQ